MATKANPAARQQNWPKWSATSPCRSPSSCISTPTRPWTPKRPTPWRSTTKSQVQDRASGVVLGARASADAYPAK